MVKASTSRSLIDIVRANVFTLFNGIIFAAMVMVLITGSWRDAVFGMIIIINTGIGICTELKAKRTLDKLSILVASDYLVHRDGKDVEIPHNDIVLGDFMWIRSGEQVPADAQIVHTWDWSWTNPCLPANHGPYARAKAAIFLWIHRHLRHGVGESHRRRRAQLRGQTYRTGEGYRKTVSDLNKGINTILKFMTFLVVPLCVLLIWSQVRTVGGWNVAISTGEWRSAVISAVAGVVGMIPEGLVLLTSLNFALAAIRLARKNTLVQELESVETLARVDCLNLDKTGTVTDGTIRLDSLELLGVCGPDDMRGTVNEHDVRQALFDLSNEGQPNGTGQAILSGLREQGFADGTVEARVPFSSARKWSSIYDGNAVWTMGAPEVILSQINGDHADILKQVNDLANDGNRVLLVARIYGAAPDDYETDPKLNPASCPVALVCCSEHIRADAEETLAWFREQGVRCRIISGDNPVTVGAIARKVHLTGEHEPRFMDARELPADITELAQVLENVDVLGRVLPDQKKAIVEALHAGEHVVAMTGDGVNDALAIKEADLGIAMGNAAPATKAVAQVVLVDSKFSHLPDVVARGRQVMANMERVASLFLVKTVYSALISLGVVLTQIPFPYLPRHITYVGGLTIGMPAFILALAPNTRRYIPGFLKRVLHFAVPCGVAVGLSILSTSWLLPIFMKWNVQDSGAQLAMLRGVNAIILLMMGVFVLARVAKPLHSWRGILVLAFAAIGFGGMLVKPVANFFALVVPTGQMLAATAVAMVLSALVFLVCLRLVPKIPSIVPYFKKTRQS